MTIVARALSLVVIPGVLPEVAVKGSVRESDWDPFTCNHEIPAYRPYRDDALKDSRANGTLRLQTIELFKHCVPPRRGPFGKGTLLG